MFTGFRSKAVVLLLLTFCLLLLPLWESVIVLCFVVRYFMSILVLQSSWWGRESWLLCLICLPGVSWWLGGSSSRCHGGCLRFVIVVFPDHTRLLFLIFPTPLKALVEAHWLNACTAVNAVHYSCMYAATSSVMLIKRLCLTLCTWQCLIMMYRLDSERWHARSVS